MTRTNLLIWILILYTENSGFEGLKKLFAHNFCLVTDSPYKVQIVALDGQMDGQWSENVERTVFFFEISLYRNFRFVGDWRCLEHYKFSS